MKKKYVPKVQRGRQEQAEVEVETEEAKGPGKLPAMILLRLY